MRDVKIIKVYKYNSAPLKNIGEKDWAAWRHLVDLAAVGNIQPLVLTTEWKDDCLYSVAFQIVDEDGNVYDTSHGAWPDKEKIIKNNEIEDWSIEKYPEWMSLARYIQGLYVRISQAAADIQKTLIELR